MNANEIRSLLREGEFLRLTCSGPVVFRQESGYCGTVHDDHFEFLQVTNKYEHFSNISDPPKTRSHEIAFGDVEAISVT